ncbi:SRPBCC family protein [Agromyces bauzanensis]
MTDFTRRYEILIDAPVHDVFEYCRDPRHLFEGWPELEVTDVVRTPEGVGTKAHIVGRFVGGLMVEQIEREYTEFVPDERIVSKAHGKVRFVGRTTEFADGPIFTWLFEARDEGTKLTFVVLEEHLGWWQNLLETVSAAVMAKKMQGMLMAIKTGVESQTSSTA